MVSLLCRLQAVSKMQVPIYPFLFCEGMTKLFDPVSGTASNETVSLEKHVTKYKNMWK